MDGETPQPKNSNPPTAAPVQFGLSSILLLMTLTAVICGVFAVAPGVAVVVALLTVPALIRTAIRARQHRVLGSRMGWGTKILTFLATLSFVVVLLSATGTAFYATCWVGFWAGAFGHEIVDPGAGFDTIGTGLIVGIALGILVAALVMWWVIRRAVKTNYRVPAWTSWFGFVAAVLGFGAFWIFYTIDAEFAIFALAISGIGLVFSLLGLGTPQRWTCAWGAALAAGPIASCLPIALVADDKAWLESIVAPVLATVITASVAAPLHLWVMTKQPPESK